MKDFWKSFTQELHTLHNDYKAKDKTSVIGKYRINAGLFKAFKAECKRRGVTMTDVIIKAVLTFLKEK